MIVTQSVLQVVCDGPDCQTGGGLCDTREQAVAQAESHNWFIFNDTHYCPACLKAVGYDTELLKCPPPTATSE